MPLWQALMAKPSHCRPFLFMPSPRLPFFIFFFELSISSHIVVWLQTSDLLAIDLKSSNCTHDYCIQFYSKSLMRSLARE